MKASSPPRTGSRAFRRPGRCPPHPDARQHGGRRLDRLRVLSRLRDGRRPVQRRHARRDRQRDLARSPATRGRRVTEGAPAAHSLLSRVPLLPDPHREHEEGHARRRDDRSPDPPRSTSPIRPSSGSSTRTASGSRDCSASKSPARTIGGRDRLRGGARGPPDPDAAGEFPGALPVAPNDPGDDQASLTRSSRSPSPCSRRCWRREASPPGRRLERSCSPWSAPAAPRCRTTGWPTARSTPRTPGPLRAPSPPARSRPVSSGSFSRRRSSCFSWPPRA